MKHCMMKRIHKYVNSPFFNFTEPIIRFVIQFTQITPILQINFQQFAGIKHYIMTSSSSPNFAKLHPIRKQVKSRSNTKFPSRKTQRVKDNFLNVLRKIAYPNHPNPTNQMISFLNLHQKLEQPSLQCIPSIQNMLSQQNIGQNPEGYSLSSIERGFSDNIITEINFQMKIMYLCVVEKILKKLQYNTSVSQRRKIIRGTWNILVKYCKDINSQIFSNIGTSIQWGLLQLINFDFRFSPKQRFLAEQLLSQKREEDEETSVQFI